VAGTMTWAAMDVHARSTHAASLDVQTGELSRRRFDTRRVEPVVAWLSGLPGPVHACYEAGPTGYGLYRAARGVGVRCDVIAPSKTPRASGEKVKDDRKDTEHLLRQLMAGALTAIVVPTASAEAARDLARAREQVRGDLMRCRHRLSKLLLRHGRVWDASTWTEAHAQWLAAQRFEQVNTELAYVDALAAGQGLLTRRQALDERLSHVAREDEFWPIVSRLRAFREIDTLSALVVALEVGDFHRFARAVQLGFWLGLVPSRHQSGETDTHRPITKTARATPGGSSSRPPGITCARHGSGSRSPPATRSCPTTSCRSPGAPSTACTVSTAASGPTRSHPTSSTSPAHASSRALCGPPRLPHNPSRQPSRSRGKAPGTRSPSARTVLLWAATTATPAPRQALADDETGTWGANPRI
jgi:transposase